MTVGCSLISLRTFSQADIDMENTMKDASEEPTSKQIIEVNPDSEVKVFKSLDSTDVKVCLLLCYVRKVWIN